MSALRWVIQLIVPICCHLLAALAVEMNKQEDIVTREGKYQPLAQAKSYN